jgi:hypothetical protein
MRQHFGGTCALSRIVVILLAMAASSTFVPSVVGLAAEEVERESITDEEPGEDAPLDRDGIKQVLDDLFETLIWTDSSLHIDSIGVFLQDRLTAELATLQTIGSLDEQQCRRLRLAGMIDVQRLVVRSRQLYEDCLQGQREGMLPWDNLFEKADWLKTPLQYGISLENSLLRRVLRKTVSMEQLRKIEQEEQAAREYEFQALLDQLLLAAEQDLILSVEQHTRLEELCQRRLKRSRRASLKCREVLLYQMSQIPEEELRSIFNVRQLRHWKHSFKQLELEEELIEELRANQLWREDPPDAQTDTAEQQPPPPRKADP